ncbi:hypothetical protein VKT23_010677 [Stygiomarasmius scandens]|uniref:F-box domain-containing protein n=1 Tax=Marasmiellus scandens TaxID=2682957 RepID=A0ABR1JDJ9_9AGAR
MKENKKDAVAPKTVSSTLLKVLCDRCSADIPKPFDSKHQFEFDPSKLRSTFTPSDRETQEVERSLPAVNREIAWYDEEIDRMKKYTSELEKKRAQAVAFRTKVQALISPIRKLPIEILGDIFYFYCQEHLTALDNGRSVSAPALRLSNVCSLWRTIILSRSDLWATIHLHPGTMRTHDFSLLSKVLSNSHQTPLDIIVHSENCPMQWMTYDNDSSRKAMKSLLENSSRWKTATLQLPFHQFKALGGGKNSTVARPEFTILEELELHFPFRIIGQSDEWWRVGSKIFESAKQLQSLGLIEYNPNMKTFLPSTFKNVRELDITLNEDSWVDVLKSFQKLEKLRILEYDGLGSSPPERIGANQIISSNLTQLRVLTSHDKRKNFGLFSYLRLPNLEHLEIDGTDNQVIWPSKSFSGMMKRAPFSLHTLSLENVSLSYKELLDILYIMPSLTRLTVKPLPENDETNQLTAPTFFHLLSTNTKYTVPLHRKPNLPLLTHADISMSRRFLNARLLASIIDMLESRLTSSTSATPGLKSFKFTAQHSLFLPQDLPLIQKFHALSKKHPSAYLDVRIFKLGDDLDLISVPLSEKAVRETKRGELDDNFCIQRALQDSAAAMMYEMLFGEFADDDDEEEDWDEEDEYGDEYDSEDEEYDSEDEDGDEDEDESEDEERNWMTYGGSEPPNSDDGEDGEEPRRDYGWDLD